MQGSCLGWEGQECAHTKAVASCLHPAVFLEENGAFLQTDSPPLKELIQLLNGILFGAGG